MRVQRVLIVDDHAEIRDVVHALVARYVREAKVDEAGDAETALTRARESSLEGQPHDVIITDFRMGHMTGLELIHILRREGHDAKTILMSGDPDAETWARQDPAVEFFFAKPFEPQAMIEALARPHSRSASRNG